MTRSRQIKRGSVAERKVQAAANRKAERVSFARTLLEQRAATERMTLSPEEYLCFRLGCSAEEAAQLVQAAGQEAR